MKLKRFATLFLCIGMTVISACGNEISDLSQEQIQEIGNYSAGILLKYDAQSRSRLVSELEIEKYDQRMARLEELRKQQEELKKNQQDENKNGEGTGDGSVNIPAHYDDLTDFYILPENVTISYDGYSVQDIYPETADAYAPVEASRGKKLLVLHFNLTNSGAETASLDFFGLKASYKITINNRYTKGIFSTLLMDDLSTYIDDLESGENQKLVLITEMDVNQLENVENVTLNIKNVSNEYTIKLN